MQACSTARCIFILGTDLEFVLLLCLLRDILAFCCCQAARYGHVLVLSLLSDEVHAPDSITSRVMLIYFDRVTFDGPSSCHPLSLPTNLLDFYSRFCRPGHTERLECARLA